MSKIMGWILFAMATWMFLSPQSLTGLKQLKWMAKYAFPGEVLLGIVVLLVAYYLIDLKPSESAKKNTGH
jgi:hypothetical protein